LYLAYLYKDLDIINSVKSDFNQNKTAYHALFTLIDSNAKIYHIADDFGQIDLLLTWQYSTHKIVSFIADEDKRDAAKVNYPVGKRNIMYTDTLTLDNQEIDTLLISTEIIDTLVIPSGVQQVFLMKKARLSDLKNLNEFTEFVNKDGVRGFERVGLLVF